MKRILREFFLVKFLICGLFDVVYVLVDLLERGINEEFLVRYFRDRFLFESLYYFSIENKLISDILLFGVLYMESMMNYIEVDRIKLYRVDDEVVFRFDERNRLSLLLFMR